MANVETDIPLLEVHSADAFEPQYHAKTRRYVLEESAARMMLRGFDTATPRYELLWPTEVDVETVLYTIWNAGNMLKNAHYGYTGAGNAKTTITTKERTPEDVNSADWHRLLVKGLVRAPIHLEVIKEFDTHSADWVDGVSWVKKWDNPDYQTDQFSIQTAGNIDLTELWVRRLIESTASEPWLQENAAQVTHRFQEVFTSERVLGSLSS